MSINETWWVEGGVNLPEGKFIRNKILTEKDINKFRFQYNNIGVFVTIYKYDSTNQKEANLLADFYLDIDNEDIEHARLDAIEAIQYMNHNFGIHPEYIKIYFSGKKGFHILVPSDIFGVKPCSNLNMIYRSMAEDISKVTQYGSIDLKIYDKRRLLRLPNSIHPSTKLYKIPITYQELKTCTKEVIQELAKEPRILYTTPTKLIPKASMALQTYVKRSNIKKVNFTNIITKPSGYIPPCIQNLLDSPVREGCRNSATAALASFYRQCGLNINQAEEKVRAWNEQRCNPCISDYEITTTLRSVYNGEYKMGCTWLSSVTDCNRNQCKIYKNRR